MASTTFARAPCPQRGLPAARGSRHAALRPAVSSLGRLCGDHDPTVFQRVGLQRRPLGKKAPPPARRLQVAAAAGPVLTNCAAAAAGIFNNVRIPAMLLAGAAVGQLWAQLGTRENGKPQTAFTMLVCATVVLEFMSVFIGTAMGVRLFADGYNPMAANAVGMLVREFELPYLAIRFCFFSGLVCFTTSLLVRAHSTLSPQLAKATSLLYAASVVQMVNFFNWTILNYRFGYAGVFWRIVCLCGQQVSALSPAALVTVALLAGSLFFAGQAYMASEDGCQA